MLVMALIAILCGSDGWDDVAEFLPRFAKNGSRAFSLPHGIPSHDTFGRVFARLDPLALEEMLREWMNALNIASGGKLIRVDGKSREASRTAWDTSGMAHIVSAFASENRVVLGAVACWTRRTRSPPSPSCWR